MISAVVLTKNEQKKIEVCLKNLLFCDEIIIIDDYSTDNTVKIASRFTNKIYKKKLDNDFAKQRNFGLKKASGEWVFFVDADEIVSEPLKNEIIKTLQNNKNNKFCGYLIKREDIFLGKRLKYGEVSNLKLLRLAKKDKGLWKRPIHEVCDIEGNVGVLKNSLLHFAHPNIKIFLKKINFYSTINAKYLFSKKVPANIKDIIIYPSIKFVLNFLFKKGFLDGLEGFIFASIMSFHSFLTRAKLYLLYYESQ